MNVGSSTSYTRAPGETTEWEDAMYKHGIWEKPKHLQKKPESDSDEEEVDTLATKSLKELKELEDEEEYSDARVLNSYRKQRIAEMKAAAAKNKFGTLRELSRSDYVKQVTEASKDHWVVLLMHQDRIEKSSYLKAKLALLAPKHKAVKFLWIVADQCVEKFPDREVPTVLLYHEGEMVTKITDITEYGGAGFTLPELEWALAQHKVLTTEQEEDPRGKRSIFRFVKDRLGDSDLDDSDFEDDD